MSDVRGKPLRAMQMLSSADTETVVSTSFGKKISSPYITNKIAKLVGNSVFYGIKGKVLIFVNCRRDGGGGGALSAQTAERQTERDTTCCYQFFGFL